jgi:hypothetical protein
MRIARFEITVVIACMALCGPLAASAQVADTATNIAQLKADVAALKSVTPSQSHAMMDVDYHFTNLWFAAQAQNWPLATFYLNETGSHLNWTVRLHPVRKLANGGDLDLAPLLRSIEQSGLAQLRTAIEKTDKATFATAYRATIAECYACHQAAEKPFLRPHVPTSPATHIIDMQPK